MCFLQQDFQELYYWFHGRISNSFTKTRWQASFWFEMVRTEAIKGRGEYFMSVDVRLRMSILLKVCALLGMSSLIIIIAMRKSIFVPFGDKKMTGNCSHLCGNVEFWCLWKTPTVCVWAEVPMAEYITIWDAPLKTLQKTLQFRCICVSMSTYLLLCLERRKCVWNCT